MRAEKTRKKERAKTGKKRFLSLHNFALCPPFLISVTFPYPLLLALLTALLCIVGVPVLATIPAANSVGSITQNAVIQAQIDRSTIQNLVQQGQDLYEAGQYTRAAEVLQQAVQTYESVGDRRNQAIALSNLALVYQELGAWTEANQAIASSLNLLRNQSGGDDLSTLAQALNIEGRLQLAQGQAEVALTTWEEATATYDQAGDVMGSIRSRMNQAQALRAMGFYRRAIATLTQLNQTLQNQPDSLDKAVGLRSLGDALLAIGDLDQSQQVLQQSLTVAEQLQSPEAIGTTQLSLGNAARAQGDTTTALTSYQQAAATSTSPFTHTQAQLNQLSLFVETEQWSDAQVLIPQIQSQLSNLPPSRATLYAQLNFARSLIKLRNREPDNREQGVNQPFNPSTEASRILATVVRQAQALGDQRAEAFALGELGGLYEQTQQWSEAQALTQQALLLSQSLNASDISYHWQWQLGRLLKVQGDTKGAIAAYNEAFNTLQSLRSDLVSVNPNAQFSFRESVEPVYRQLIELLLQPVEGAEPTQQNLIQVREVLESLQVAELENFFREACLEASVEIDRVVDQAAPSSAVIYPIILPNRLEVVFKLPQQVLRHYSANITQAEVEATLRSLRQQLTRPYPSQETSILSAKVYDWLIRPAEAALDENGIDTLVFVLDGALRNVPMAALYDGQKYLIEKYSVALTPGLQLLNPQPLQREQLKALIAGLSEARHNFPQLNYVEDEVEEIGTEVPSVVLFNQGFTKNTLQSQINSSPFSIVHIATHGQFSSNANDTFILAWDQPINVSELSSLLRSRDEARSLPIELLVLSACQTAVGDQRAALGLAGVAVRAGARSTLASLWNLDDESSAFLMSTFYHELANTKVTKAEALRRAQLELLAHPLYKRPRYWAPFVLLGNWL